MCIKQAKMSKISDIELFDPKFSIHPVALSIANLLHPIEADESKVNIKTYAFYNGRERAICIHVGYRYTVAYNVVFGEVRNSDSIFIDCFEAPIAINPPTVGDLTDEAYKNRKYLKYNQTYEAADAVNKLIIDWIAKKEAESAVMA